jgi:hypothetical protein
MAEARDPTTVAKSLTKRLAQDQSDILHGVMAINLKVTLCVDLEIEMAVTRDLGEHVIEKRNTRRDVMLTVAIQIQTDPNFRFVGFSRSC